jgi:lipopolysaccharide assembly outer membrane protein LptD (OstA)
VRAESVSDTHYFEDFSQGPEGASTAFLERAATFSYRDEHWRVDAQAQQYQTIDIENVQLYERPYARVPRIVVNSDWSYGENIVARYGFDSEVVNFRRSIEAPDSDGWRLDLLPRLARPDRRGLPCAPGLAWRLTQYELDSLGPGQTERSPSRTPPIAFDTDCCSSAAPARATSVSSRSSRASCTCTCRTGTRTSCPCSTRPYRT